MLEMAQKKIGEKQLLEASTVAVPHPHLLSTASIWVLHAARFQLQFMIAVGTRLWSPSTYKLPLPWPTHLIHCSRVALQSWCEVTQMCSNLLNHHTPTQEDNETTRLTVSQDHTSNGWLYLISPPHIVSGVSNSPRNTSENFSGPRNHSQQAWRGKNSKRFSYPTIVLKEMDHCFRHDLSKNAHLHEIWYWRTLHDRERS